MSRLEAYAFPQDPYMFEKGLSIREYIAIQYMIPNSGNADIDKMIKESMAQKTGKAAFSMPPSPEIKSPL
jgi:hypothetical protein